MKDNVDVTRDRRVFIRPRDFFVLAVLIGLALILYIVTWTTRTSSECVAKIYHNGQLLEVVKLEHLDGWRDRKGGYGLRVG